MFFYDIYNGRSKVKSTIKKRIIESLDYTRWLGWTKMHYEIKTGNGIKAVIHYVRKWENDILVAVDDFKFKKR